jgi:hypothetical protein
MLGAALVAAALARRDHPILRRWTDASSRGPAIVALLLSVLTCVLGLSYGAFVAGGSDAYGYVSQARLWRQGSLRTEIPLALEMPWRDGPQMLAPVGYVAAPTPGFIVPTYPPGLPIAMAALQSVVGEFGAYLVVPLTGALAVWWTYRLGILVAGPIAGMIAAAALFASPSFLLQLMLPMSDMPAMAWWLLAFVLAWRDERVALMTSGVAAAMAVATRPNLAALGIVLFALVIARPGIAAERIRRAALWGLPALIGPLFVAILNDRLYGSALRSGYGDASFLYSLDFFWPNVQRYTGWLLDTQTPFIVLGVMAVPLLRGHRRSARVAAWALLFAAIVVLSYLWYLAFDDWAYVRFLLPAYPMLLATAAAALVLLVRGPRSRTAAAAVIAAVIAYELSGTERAFGNAESERRYRDAAEAARQLPPEAVIISNLHSGSVRYYADRLTIRFERLQPDNYHEALAFLRAHGRVVYVMLDDAEVDLFKRLYSPVTDLSWLNAPPLWVVDGRVRLYRLPT